MSSVVKDAFFLGNFADADTDELTYAVENTGVYAQTFGSPAAPLTDGVESLTFDDVANDGSIDTDNVSSAETIANPRGMFELDCLAAVTVMVTYADGATASYANVVMFQLSNGDLYLGNSNYAGTDIRGSPKKLIDSVTVDSVMNTNYTDLCHHNLKGVSCFDARASGNIAGLRLGGRFARGRFGGHVGSRSTAHQMGWPICCSGNETLRASAY